MKIDLKTLYNNDIIDITREVNIPLEYYQDTEIKDLQNVRVEGKIFNSLASEVELSLKVKGTMILEDAYSLELVSYPFNFDLDESLKISQNIENILDLTEILWQNIVLEVPISYSKEKQVAKLNGEGWELRDKNTKKIDSRFAKLTELLEKGKE